MSTYTPTGNPISETRGTSSLVRNEFALVATAVNSKADVDSPAFTGTPTAPTPATTDNSTKLATTAMVQGLVATMPAGTLPSIAGKGLNTLRVNVAETGVEWGSNSGSDLYLAATFGAL